MGLVLSPLWKHVVFYISKQALKGKFAYVLTCGAVVGPFPLESKGSAHNSHTYKKRHSAHSSVHRYAGYHSIWEVTECQRMTNDGWVRNYLILFFPTVMWEYKEPADRVHLLQHVSFGCAPLHGFSFVFNRLSSKMPTSDLYPYLLQ